MTPLCNRCHDGAAKHMLPCPKCGLRATISWKLDGDRINDLQQQSIAELVKRCKAAHFVDVHVRINGKWEIYQADWIKHMRPFSSVVGQKQEGLDEALPERERGTSNPPDAQQERRA